MTENQQTGTAGEEKARIYLIEQNYTILETNWRSGHLEIDIIALDQGTLVFVEVKTRGSDAISSPQQAVNQQKQKNLIRAANSYILKNNCANEVRFDIISVVQNRQGTQLEHIRDAYSPKW